VIRADRLLNASGSVTECVFGSKTGGLRSPSTNDAASGPSAKPAHLGQHLVDGVGIQGRVFAWPNALSTPRTSKRLEYLVTHVALVVAHYFLLVENATHGWVLLLSYPTSNSVKNISICDLMQVDVDYVSSADEPGGLLGNSARLKARRVGARSLQIGIAHVELD